MNVVKIISGGQTGADRAGLDFAIESGMEHGGNVPNGRKSEDGIVPLKYNMVETPYSDYRKRTELNVKNSDATLIFTFEKIGPGSVLTMKICDEMKKPHMHVDLDISSTAEVYRFLEDGKFKVLNVAGSRESKSSGVYDFTLNFLRDVFGKI